MGGLPAITIQKQEFVAVNKLMINDVLSIVKRVKEGEKASSLATEYEVSKATISKILSGSLYKRITGIRKGFK